MSAFIYLFFCKIIIFSTWHSGTACSLQILRDGFGSRQEPIAFDLPVAADSRSSSSLRAVLITTLNKVLLNFLFRDLKTVLILLM